jgi:hypothetical protein
LQLKDKNSISDMMSWCAKAKNIIYEFEQKTEIENILGEVNYDVKAPEGYTVAQTYGLHNFYFCIAFHPFQIIMGVVIKFSAQALDFYLKNAKINVYQFLQQICNSNLYLLSCSRIDLTVDYINNGINVTAIYRELETEKIALFQKYFSKQNCRFEYRKVKMTYQGIIKQNEIPTIYIGSPKSKARLRIYDKKREQIEKVGTKYDKAKNCESWVRFECVLRHSFSRQFAESLLFVTDDIEYTNLIANTILQKYSFFYVDNGVIDCETDYTKLLVDNLNNSSIVLSSLSSRNYNLENSIYHLFYGSGLISILKKIKAIFGVEAVKCFLDYVADTLEDFETNNDCIVWMKKNVSYYKECYTNFQTYLQSVIEFIEQRRS